MSRIHFDSLHSIEVEGDSFLVRTTDLQNRVYEWTVSKEVAALIVIGLREASIDLPADTEESWRAMNTLGFQALVGPNMTPALQIQLAEKLFLILGMSDSTLAALQTSIAQLRSSISFDGPKH